MLNGIVMSKLPDFPIDGTDSDFEELKVEPFRQVKDLIIGVELAQPYMLGDEERVRMVVMDLPTLVKNVDDVLGLTRGEDGTITITNEGFGEMTVEEVEDRINSEVMGISEVQSVISSKDKSRRIFINNNEMYLKANKDLTKEELGMLHFISYIKVLTQLNDLRPMAKPATSVMKIFKQQSYMYLNYINDHNYMYELEEYTPNLNDALEIFKEYYMEDLTPQEGTGDGHTNLFGGDNVKDKISPLYIFQVNKDYTYLIIDDVNQEQKELGCRMKAVRYESETMELVNTKLKGHVKGFSALNNLIIIMLDEDYKQGMFLDYEDKHLIRELVKETLKTDDMKKAQMMVREQLRRQEAKRKG